MHFVGPDQLHGFEERWTQDIYPATFDWTRPHRKRPPVNPGQNIDRVFETGPGWTTDMDYDEEVMFRAQYGLRRMIRGGVDRPFMMCVSFTGPHYPYKAPQQYWDLYSDDDVRLPRIPEDYKEREHAYVKWLRRHGKFHELVPDDVCRSARRAILGRISMIDDYLARILALVEEGGLAEDTIVIYTSDHGDMMGEHGLWFKNAAYEWSSRVPWIVRGPDIATRRIDEAASLLDIGPTLCGLVDIEPVYQRTDGRDLSDLLTGEREPGPGLAIMENYGEGMHRGSRTVRKGQHKLTYVPGHEPELFDLAEDPDEWNDLAANTEYSDVRKELEDIALEGWAPEECDERCWRSEERRLAVLKACGSGRPAHWQTPSPPVPHPLRSESGSIDNVDVG
jgi:choline-sulfatase